MKTKDYSTINIFEINKICFNLGVEYKNQVSSSSSNLFGGRNWVYGFLSVLYLFLYNMVFGSFKFKNKGHVEVLYYGLSLNNQRALEKIYSCDTHTNIILCNPADFPNWKKYYYSFFYLYSFFKVVKNADLYEREIIKTNFTTFFSTYGTYQLMEEMMKIYTPQIVVVANDHNPDTRSLQNICNKKGIHTIYIQHAAVTNKFPNLDFSYSFLDGKESYLKYKENNVNRGNVYLVGGVRYDGVKRNNSHQDPPVIGVALNEFDDINVVEEVILKLKAQNINTIIVRPHPRQANKSFEKWCKKQFVNYSNSKIETSFEFINSIDLLIANESSIHLDAKILRCPSYLINFSNEIIRDHYGFLNKGLVKELKSADNLMLEYRRDINMLSTDYSILKEYYAAYDTKYEGNVSFIIQKLIDSILSNNMNYLEFEQMYNFKLIEKSNQCQVFEL